jgi:hypothetical protein
VRAPPLPVEHVRSDGFNVPRSHLRAIGEHFLLFVVQAAFLFPKELQRQSKPGVRHFE